MSEITRRGFIAAAAAAVVAPKILPVEEEGPVFDAKITTLPAAVPADLQLAALASAEFVEIDTKALKWVGHSCWMVSSGAWTAGLHER